MSEKRSFEKVYVNDFDGNILHTSTPIVLEEKQQDWTWKTVQVSIPEYDSNTIYRNKERYRYLKDKAEDAFQHARDFFNSDIHRWPQWLQDDIMKALENGDFAPSFEKFKQEVLIEWNLFAINTARGHTPDNIKHSLKMLNTIVLDKAQQEQQIEIIKKKFLREKLSDKDALWKYFDMNIYMPVSNIEICKFLQIDNTISSAIKKTLFQDWYISHLTKIISHYQLLDKNNPIKMWFSDDSYSNIEEMVKYFLTIKNKHQWPYHYYDYRIYYTGEKIDIIQENIENYLINNLKKDPNDTIVFQKQKSSAESKLYDILKITL